MNYGEQAYLNLCTNILENGAKKDDRTNTGTYSIFGYQMRLDLSEGFPLLTTKRDTVRLVASELLGLIKWEKNIRYLVENNNNIWNECAFKKWVKSDDYTGPDMTDFGNRSLKDPAFKKTYDIHMKKFKQQILTDD